MQYKKNKKYDLERRRPLFFGIGMIISLSMTITAFEWKTELDPIVIPQEPEEEYWYPIDVTRSTKQDVPELPKILKSEAKTVLFKDIVEVLEKEIISNEPEFQVDEIEGLIEENRIEAPTVEDAPFEIVEEMPSYPGGELELIRFLASKTKYPRAARNIGVQGRVYLQFIVEKDGSLSEIEVIKGIGAGCDKEAVRVMSLVPNFKPGKQRGQPVRVKMIIPINFSLQ